MLPNLRFLYVLLIVYLNQVWGSFPSGQPSNRPSGQPTSEPSIHLGLMYDHSIMKIVLPNHSSVWINPLNTQAVYDVRSNSLKFDRSLKQYVDLGGVTLNTQANGFTATVVFTWTGSIGAWERFIDCNVMISRQGDWSQLVLNIYSGTSLVVNFIASYVFQQNTPYVVTFVYYSSSFTSMLYVNSVWKQTYMAAPFVASPVTLTHCYVGKSSGNDAFLNANIYFLAAYDHNMTDSAIRLQHLQS